MRDFSQELYGLRTLVMMEVEDGKFYQVILTPEQFKKVSDAIFVPQPTFDKLKDGMQVGTVQTADVGLDADLFIGMSDF
jgi:hypothetical protein